MPRILLDKIYFVLKKTEFTASFLKERKQNQMTSKYSEMLFLMK